MNWHKKFTSVSYLDGKLLLRFLSVLAGLDSFFQQKPLLLCFKGKDGANTYTEVAGCACSVTMNNKLCSSWGQALDIETQFFSSLPEEMFRQLDLWLFFSWSRFNFTCNL